MESKINLKSSDGYIFSVEMKVVFLSTTLKTMINELGFDIKDEEKLILLHNVDGAILQKVIEWCSYHQDDPLCIEGNNREISMDDITGWDAQFFQVNISNLLDLIMAAYDLDIKGLVELASLIAAMLIKSRNKREITSIFQLKQDSTPTEKN